jgi:hypothetical protein
MVERFRLISLVKKDHRHVEALRPDGRLLISTRTTGVADGR